MRILVDYRPALRARTGVGEYIRELVREYAAAHDDDVAVFTSSWKDRPPIDLGHELAARVIDRKVPVAVLNYLWHRFEWPPVETLAGPFDVVHAAHPLLIPSSRAAQVVTIHDLFFLDQPGRLRGEIRRDYPALAGDHARRADAIITSSQSTRHQITARLGVPADRVYCCPPGAPEWRRLGVSPNVPADGYVLFLGTLEARKNIGVLLDAWTLLTRRDSRTPRLVLAGGATPDANDWLARAARAPLSRCVEHLGYVSDDRREQLFAGARALVLPSLDEGFGLTALEAMSAGVPVLASDRGSLPEVVGSAGMLLSPTDVEGWASAIHRVTTDTAWATELACAGLERAKAFTWPNTAAQLQQAYVDAVARRGRR